LKFTTSLKKNYEFRRLYNKGKSAASQCAVVYCRRNGSKANRLGITVSTKLGGAVQRNRIRRRLKEIYRLNEGALSVGYDVVIVARMRSRYAAYQELQASVLSLFRKLKLTADGAGTPGNESLASGARVKGSGSPGSPDSTAAQGNM